jgi:indolepyruvate decarboxylase
MQIDMALTACISQKRPVAIEIMEDCYYMPCPEPIGDLTSIPPYESYKTLIGILGDSDAPPSLVMYAKQIVISIDSAAQRIYEMLAASKKPMFWIGKEIELYDLQQDFLGLQQVIPAPYVTSLLGKSVLPENNSWFAGTYDSIFTSTNAQQYLQESDLIIALGVWNTDLNNFKSLVAPATDIAPVLASRGMVKIENKMAGRTDTYLEVPLENLIARLHDLAEANNYKSVWNSIPPIPPPVVPPATNAITYDGFYDILNGFITPSDIVVSDIGLSVFGGGTNLQIKGQNGFLCQSIWASIGWSVPAALGASYGSNQRVIVVVGDGAFKLTCQEISTIIEEQRNVVVFVLNNGVYAVEQMLLNPVPFKQGSNEPFEPTNILPKWDYTSLMRAFVGPSNVGGMAAEVNTVQDMLNTLNEIFSNVPQPWLVSINLAYNDYPAAWNPFVNPAKVPKAVEQISETKTVNAE